MGSLNPRSENINSEGVKQSETGRELNRLMEVQDKLRHFIGNLEQKLSPVLRSPQPKPSNVEKASEPMTDLGRAIRTSRMVNEDFINVISDLIERLEI